MNTLFTPLGHPLCTTHVFWLPDPGCPLQSRVRSVCTQERGRAWAHCHPTQAWRGHPTLVCCGSPARILIGSGLCFFNMLLLLLGGGQGVWIKMFRTYNIFNSMPLFTFSIMRTWPGWFGLQVVQRHQNAIFWVVVGEFCFASLASFLTSCGIPFPQALLPWLQHSWWGWRLGPFYF